MISGDTLERMFNMHIRECDARDASNNRAIEKIETAVENIQNQVVSLQIKLGSGFAFIMVLSKILDYYLAYHGGNHG